MELTDYLTSPWTVRRHDHEDDGTYVSLTIDELPGFVAAGRTDEEVEEVFWGALQAFISSYIEAGETPPVPRTSVAPQLELLNIRYQRPEMIARYPAEASRSRVGAPTAFHALGVA